MTEATLVAEYLSKTFSGANSHTVLSDISLSVGVGESVAIMGASGEGKSTLLHILGTLERPSKGTVKICGKVPTPSEEADVRNQHVGFIFQSYYLLEDFTVLENVTMPLKIGRKKGKDLEKMGKTILKEVGLKGKENQLAKTLSGGEKQRVAIARALITKPDLILADEPTGNLDRATSLEIQELLLNMAKKRKKALVVVTHDEEFAKECQRLLILKEGQLYTRS